MDALKLTPRFTWRLGRELLVRTGSDRRQRL